MEAGVVGSDVDETGPVLETRLQAQWLATALAHAGLSRATFGGVPYEKQVTMLAKRRS